jgi:hypothetical protein
MVTVTITSVLIVVLFVAVIMEAAYTVFVQNACAALRQDLLRVQGYCMRVFNLNEDIVDLAKQAQPDSIVESPEKPQSFKEFSEHL